MTSANSIDPGLLARAAQALAALLEAARLGGEIAMRDFASGAKTGANVQYKDGGSPVTSADLAVDRFLRARLGPNFPMPAGFPRRPRTIRLASPDLSSS